jgi:DNA helicase-2/ATP-dependent DNA helicase PcrA
MIEEFSARIDTEDAYSLGKDIIEKSGLLQDIASDITDISKKENVEELFAALSDFVTAQSAAGDSEDVTLRDYLARVSLLSDMDNDTGDQDRVTLMTIHSAKGLEYEAVMIAGAEEEIIPGSQSFYNRKELEEERRLFYVALTRAKKLCYISYAHFRFAYGSMTESEPSRFIKEISESCIINHDDAIAAPSVRERRPQNLYSASNSYSGDRKLSYYTRREWSASGAGRLTVEARDDDAARELQEARTKDGVRLLKGDRVEHPRFGEGSVVAFESAGDTVKARIKFDSAGEKDLLLKFAPLQKLPQ